MSYYLCKLNYKLYAYHTSCMELLALTSGTVISTVMDFSVLLLV